MATKTTPKPPRHLGRSGRQLWLEVIEQFAIDDAAGLALLGTAAECLDRMRQAQDDIAARGAMVKDRYGQLKANPATRVELDSRNGFLGRAARAESRAHTAGETGRNSTIATRRHARKQRLDDISDADRATLIDGRPTLLHPDRLRALWFEHREQLLEEWIAEHPHSRPWAWWQFESSEPRRQIGGRGILMSQRYRNLNQLYERGMPLFDSVELDDPPRFESERNYLDRLGISD